MKKIISFLAIFCAIFVGCNACLFEKNKTKYGLKIYNNPVSEVPEKGLIEHITKRTVRILTQCKIVSLFLGITIKPYETRGYGTGIILVSTENHSLIQTAQHVIAKQTKNLSGGKKLVCDKIAVERRDKNNKILSVYSDQIEVVASKKAFDLAVIKIFENFGVSTVIADSLYLGQSIRVAGYPALQVVKSANLSYEIGQISTYNISKNKIMYDLVRIGAAGYFGNSGSGVWDQKGRLVSMVSALSGFRNIFGEIIPRQNCMWGPGVKALKLFYSSHKGLHIVLEK
jgi:S1-C subfamily serine protease